MSHGPQHPPPHLGADEAVVEDCPEAVDHAPERRQDESAAKCVREQESNLQPLPLQRVQLEVCHHAMHL